MGKLMQRLAKAAKSPSEEPGQELLERQTSCSATETATRSTSAEDTASRADIFKAVAGRWVAISETRRQMQNRLAWPWVCRGCFGRT